MPLLVRDVISLDDESINQSINRSQNTPMPMSMPAPLPNFQGQPQAPTSRFRSTLSPWPTPSHSLPSPKPRRAPTHHLALTHQLGIELAPVQREVDVEIDAVKSPLRRIHALEVLFQILATEIRSQGDDLLDT